MGVWQARQDQEGKQRLKQELVASSAYNNIQGWQYGRFPQGGRLLVLLPVTKTFHDCPPAPCTLQFVTSLLAPTYYGTLWTSKKRGWMRLLWGAAWPHMH